MRRFYAVVVRELAQRGNVVAAGVLLAAVPHVVGRLIAAPDRAAAVFATSVVLATMFGCAVTWLVGATMIASDASAHRLSFYVARPLPPATLWFGKLAANTLVLALLLTAIAWPAIRTHRGVPLLLLLVPILLASAHAGSMLIRARGAGLLAGAAAVVLAAFLAYRTMSGFRDAYAPYAGYAIVALWIVAGLVALLRCGVAHLRSGAWSVRAGSRALQRSFAVWLLAVGIAASALYGGYVVLASPFHGLLVGSRAHSGDWMFLASTTPLRLDYVGAGLLNVRTGRGIALPGNALAYGNMESSADGRHIYVSRFDGPLVHVAARPRAAIENLPWNGELLAVAPDGSRIAFATLERVMIADVPARRILWNVRYDVRTMVSFDAARRAHVAIYDGRTLTILHLDETGRTLGESRAPLGELARPLTIRDDGGVLAASRTTLSVFGGDAKLLWSVPLQHTHATPLADGRVILTTAEAERTTFTLLSRDGATLRTVTFPWPYAYVLSNPTPSSLVVMADVHHAELLDLDRGVARDLGDVWPVVHDVSEAPRGSVAAVFRRGDDLVRIDPVSGAATIVFRGKPLTVLQKRVLDKLASAT